MTREEQKMRQQEQKRERRHRERAAWEAARGPMDVPFLLMVCLLLVMGLIMVLSASFPSAQAEGNPFKYFRQQTIFGALGFAFMLFVSRVNYQRLRGFAHIALYGSIFLLILVIIPGVGITRNQATRWLGISDTGFTFQPSEIAKLGVIIYFAATISIKRERMQKPLQVVFPYLVILGVMSVLMAMEPHVSGMVLIVGIGLAMLAVGGIHWGWIAVGGAGAVGGVYLVLFTDLMEKIGYNSHRITTWKDPFWDAGDKSYQMAQSFITIGSGGLLGVGLGKSRQKFMFLPEEHNDFIFAVICEELGLIGATVIMVLFSVLILRGYWIALRAKDRFGSLLVVGVVTQIALQAFLNIAVVTGFIPNTGISLPFFSYGGTALMIQLAEVGIVLSVSRQIPAPKGG